MAASTITRGTFVDGTTPWNSSNISSLIYDRIDQLFSGVGGYATLELGGALKINGALTQLSNDGGALGTSSLGWSDLFLASGAVINFNNGDVTLTHSTNTLTFAGATSGYNFSDGPLKTPTTVSVGNATPASTGAGITFPAAQSASSDVNTLDDYEEGTWTGTLAGSTTNPTTPVQVTGQYTKIGRVVHVQINFANVNTAGAAGNVTVTGLPFTIANLAGPVGAAYSSALNFNGGDALWAVGSAASTTVSFLTNGGAFNSLLHNGANGVYLYFSLTYFV